MKTILIDKNTQSKEVIFNILKNIKNIDIIGTYDYFNEDINFDELNLVIFDINSKTSDEILEKIKSLKTKFSNLKFIALSYEINSLLVSQILKAGVNDFLLKPILPNILETSIKKIDSNYTKKAKTMCVFANKGGVGKTTFACNLAWEIYQKTNEKICILDLSFNSEDVREFLKIEQKRDSNYILSNIESLNEKTFLSILDSYKDSKIYLLELQNSFSHMPNFTPDKIAKLINSLKNFFDYIIIDTLSIIDENSIAIFDNSDLILLLTTTNLNSIKNCQKCCELFDKIGYNDDKIKVIVNRNIENEELRENEIKKEIFAKIPNNYLTLIDSINQGKNVGETNPQSNIAKAYSKIAQDILNIDFASLNTKIQNNHGIFNLLKRMGEE